MPYQVLSVGQINEYIRRMIDSDDFLSGVAVKGEISNYKVYPSGHHYFTIKDDSSSLKCVMFKSSAIRLRFRPENGMKVIAMGKISVYPRDGAYQLYCTGLTADGVGDLHVAFEQLKQKLSSQGMFEQAHKKPLPAYPCRIGIVTSSAGAAIHDILRVLNKRFPLAKVLLFPVRVQGVEAPAEITSAIQYANRYKLADLLIVGRGGGSLEDLWAFNDELVAHAIYNSEIPVISAVGHEPDITISDYVADLRAATPSNAAELAVPDQDALYQNLDSVMSGMTTAILRQLKASRQHLTILSTSALLRDPSRQIHLRKEKLANISSRLVSAQQNNLSLMRRNFSTFTAKLDAMSPLKVLTRGYSMICTEDNKVITSKAQIHSGDTLEFTFSDGSVKARVDLVEE